MRQLVAWLTALTFAVSPAMAGTSGNGEKSPSQPAKAAEGSAPAAKATGTVKAEASPKPETSNMELELEQLRDLLQQQTQELQAQRAALHEQQQKMQALEDQLKMANAPRENISAAPGNAVNASTVSLGSNVASATASYNGDQDKKPDESPTSIHYKGITITPGGFLAAETVWRERGLTNDVNTDFKAIPFNAASISKISEFNASGRQSRISLLAEGKLNTTKLTGYYETDWLSAGVTSNNGQSNSYTNRQRQIWGQAALESGWTFTGGQMWSLVTETKKGVQNRTEAPPLTIDAQYTVGFSWARQYAFRVARNWNTVALAFSVEDAQTTLAAHGNASNFVLGNAGDLGGLFNNQANYSFNQTPDFIVKAAFDPGWGHYEVFGLVTVFRDRIFPCATASATAPCTVNGSTFTAPTAFGAGNDSRTGGGGGANVRVPLFGKKLDVGGHFFGGEGVGRYGTTGLQDATVRPNGTLALLRSAQGLVSLEWHAASMLDVYLYGGTEYLDRNFYVTSFTPPVKSVGYGSPFFSNGGCGTETLPGSGNGFSPGSLGSCTVDTKSISEATLGYWHRFYKGPKGTLQWGAQYSYVVRSTWSGLGSATSGSTAHGSAPHGIESMVFTSFRYYIP
jgi:hypothetical protein